MNTSAQPTPPAETADDTFFISRVVSGTPQQVLDAFTQPDQLKAWWGPHLVKVTDLQIEPPIAPQSDGRFSQSVVAQYRLVQEFAGALYPLKGELRTGGAARGTPTTPQNASAPVPLQLVMTMDCSEHPPAWHDAVDPNRGDNTHPAGLMVMTVTLEAVGSTATQVSICTGFSSAAVRNSLVPMGMETGWDESLEKLEELVSGRAARSVSVSRLYQHPVESVYAAFTQAVHLAQWWGPNGFSITTHRFEFRVGGVWAFTMHGPAVDGKPGVDYPNKIVYTDIVPCRCIANQHGDDKMDDSGRGALFQAVISFAPFAGQTRVTNRVMFADVAQRNAVVKAANAIKGGEETLARLAQFLSGKA